MSVARRAVRLHCAGVGDVHLFVIRAEAEAVALGEPVGHTPDLARRGLEPVDLAGELWRGPEGLFVTIRRVGEPEVVVGVVDYDIVQAVERTAMEVVEEGLRCGGGGIDQDQG